MTCSKLLRQCIQHDKNELLIFGADNFAQFPRRDASVSSKCDRALAIACNDDLVVLRTQLEPEYQAWLRSHGLGSDNVVEYKASSKKMTLSELIVDNPEPIKKFIKKFDRKPVYIPWFSGHMENEAAKVLGAELFGASEAETIKYNDKASFKAICQELDIPVVKGCAFEINSEKSENSHKFKDIIENYLPTSMEVIIRGTLGEAGMSLYRTRGDDIGRLYRQIAETGEKVVIIEPFLDVIVSPNDQWAIDRKGEISHLGIRRQICERGMVHVGTLHGEKNSQDLLDYISKTSLKIVRHMARSGYRGVVGIDYIVTENGIFPIENNARFNGSSHVSMIVDNIEAKLKSPVPFWKFIKIKTLPCSFSDLTKRMESMLYDGRKSNCVFPFNCNALSMSGDFAVVLLGGNMDHIMNLEKALGQMGVKRD